MLTQWHQQPVRYTCFQKESNVWNKIFKKELIAKDHRIQNKWIKYKIFELKYANRNIIR